MKQSSDSKLPDTGLPRFARSDGFEGAEPAPRAVSAPQARSNTTPSLRRATAMKQSSDPRSDKKEGTE